VHRKLFVLSFIIFLFISCSPKSSLYLTVEHLKSNPTIDFYNKENLTISISIGVFIDSIFQPIKFYSGAQYSESFVVTEGLYYLAYSFYSKSGEHTPWYISGQYYFDKDNYYTITFLSHIERLNTYKNNPVRSGRVIVSRMNIWDNNLD